MIIKCRKRTEYGFQLPPDWTEEHQTKWADAAAWCSGRIETFPNEFFVRTQKGWTKAFPGDVILRDPKGFWKIYNGKVFEETYEVFNA